MNSERPYREESSATAILQRLRESDDAFLTIADMRHALKIPRSTVLKQIRRLRMLGCKLEGQESTGYRLLEDPDSLRPEVVLGGLPVTSWGHPYHSYENVTSTNDLCHAWAQGGAPEGAVVVAETQSKGRGRLGRHWYLAKGKGLTFSVLLRPQLPPNRLSLLTLASAVGVSLALEEEGAEPGIKWPNDVELKGRKVCGILTEAQTDPDRLQYAVVGLGINVNAETVDFPTEIQDRAIGLSEALGHSVHRAAFFKKVLKHLQEAHGWLVSGKADRLLKEWRLRSTVLGRQVKIRQGERTLFGHALDVDDQGALLVRTDWGFTEAVTVGDVENLRLLEPGVKILGKSRKRPRRL
jgi:BirA family biotin operon repressor/biotin-[acetyl-CoA-carboxylase] ligase